MRLRRLFGAAKPADVSGFGDNLAGHCREQFPTTRCGRNRALTVATGGMAHLIGGASDSIDEIEPSLTLLGLAILYELNA